MLLMTVVPPVVAGPSYNWPADLTGSPFNCYNNGVYGCYSSVNIPQDAQITLTGDTTVAIAGNFTIQSGFLGVITNGYALNITVYGNVTINQGSNFSANLTATGDITLGNQTTFTGDITSYSNVAIGSNSTFNGNLDTTGSVTIDNQVTFTGDISTFANINIGTNGIFTGDITTTGALSIGSATVVYGACTPSHPQCGLAPPSCDTLADNFGLVSYGNQDGSVNWASNWIEGNDDGDPSNGDIRISGNRLLIENSDRSITRNADLSSYTTSTLTFDYQENGFDNNNDYVDIEVRGGGNGWTSLQHFAGSSVGSGSSNTTVPSSFLANDFSIRLITSPSLASNDQFYVDNFRIEVCGSASVAANMDFHFDESNWTGIPDEVVDSSANANHASISSGSGVNTIAMGQLCRAGQFDGVNDYLVSNDIYAALRTTASMSFWIKTTQTGNNTNWQAPGVAGVEQAGLGDDIFWGWLDASGHIGISKWDTPSAKSSVAINDGVYHHVVLTRDSPSGAYKIYIDGALNAYGTTGSGDVGTSFTSIGRIEDTGGSPEYLQAELDELLVFDTVLSDTQVSSIYTNQRDGKNYDGSPRACLDSPLVEWHFDETGWNGSAGEVLDSQGTVNASAVNGANTGGANPALAGDPGTCRYGTFDGTDDYVDLTGMPELTGSFTITAWVYANETGNDQRIFVDDQNNSNGFGLSLGDGGNGQLRFFSRSVNPVIVDTQNAEITAEQWYHLAVVHDISAKTRQIYVDGTAVALSTGGTISTYSGTWGVDTGAASIGGENNSAGEANANFRFNGNIDEVRVYESVLSANQITTVMNFTRPCGATGPDHYEISHSGTGITCAPETVTVTAHNADHSLFSVANDTSITVTSSPAVDAISSSPVTILAGQSSATFTITETTMTASPHVNINVSDGAVSETSGSATAADDPALVFVDSLFQFVRDTSIPPATHINTQIGGKPSSTAPNTQNLYLRAVRTDDTTGSPVCVAALDAGTHDINMGYQCLDPNNCTADELSVSNNLIYDSNAATTLAHNDGATMGNSSAVTLNFDNSGYAPLSFVYNNVGEIALFAGDYITLNGGTITSGISDQFVVRPFGLTLDFDNGSSSYNMRQQDWSDGVLDGSAGDASYSDPSTNPQNSTVFQTAGSNFPAEITAVLWQAGDDSDNNGEPDAAANLYNNASATLFGQQSTSVMQITHTLQEPAGANSGILTSTFTNPYVNGATTGSMNWNEVGIIDIQLSLTSFLGDTSFTSSYTAEDVGRFRPAGFRIKTGSVNDGVLDNSCGTFNYIGQDFGYLVNPAFVVEAINAASAVTTNYRADWNKLTSASFPISVVSNDGSNALDIVHTQAGINYNPAGYGVFNVAFGDDTFCYGLDVSGVCVKQSNAQLAEFTADITMSLATISDGEVSTAIGQDFSPILGKLRYGRLAMDNVFGSELVGLSMPMHTQYYDGSNYILNEDDGCTTVDHNVVNELIVTPVLSGGTSTVTVISTTAVGGVLDISLTAPGANNIGYIDVVPDLTISGETWLQYDWDSTIPGLENPSGRANFGIYNGDSRQIYIRQIY